jgi:hypothetical protein
MFGWVLVFALHFLFLLFPVLLTAPDFDGSRISRLPKLGFFFLTSNITTRARVPGMMASWGDRIRHHPAVSDFVFASIEDPTFSYLPSADVFPHYAKLLTRLRHFSPSNIGVRLLVKDIFTIEYCVRNTSADWCFRLMDDLYVNEDAFDDFVHWIAARPNPRTTPYVIGNCLLTRQVGFYLQGGSGYAFSRFAAERLVEVYEEWLLGIDMWEDFYITKFIKSLGIRSQACDCPYFSGHFIRWALWLRWKWTSRFVPQCPQKLQTEKYCAHRIVPVRKLVFIHSLLTFMTHERWVEGMKKVPENAMIYYNESAPIFCFGTPEQIAEWDVPQVGGFARRRYGNVSAHPEM